MDTIILESGGLRSSVVVDGSHVPHYGVQYDEEANEMTSWIVSEPDKPFAVRLQMINRIPEENYVIHIYLDGHKAAGCVVRPQDPSVFLVKSMRVSHAETRHFMFGSLELSDDDTLLEASSAQALGEIKVLLYRAGTMVPSNSNGNFGPAPQAQKVHERAKKGLTHSVKYGGTQIDPLNPAAVHFTYLDKTLIVSHITRYRPLAMLQANGIVPYVSVGNQQNASKSPAPAPSPSSAKNSKKRKALREEDVKPVIGLSDDDEEGIAQKENELKAQLAQLQKKRARLQRRPVKQEEEEEERKPILHGEIIDLKI